ncbi:MAG: NAD(P)/FAD-dependent oxidoreductase [Methylophaga sp.]|nr:NAD(P)/FAD-dependent oxidoreductase [Methylophaga sp.]
MINDPSIIEIAGAGPAGLAAAITLAHAGRQVIVYEAQKEVGHRFGGDFQGLENWTSKTDVLDVLRNWGLTTAFTAIPCNNGSAYDAQRQHYTFKSDTPLFYMIERGPGPNTLDSALLQQAQDLGVEVRFNHRLKQMTGQGVLAAGPRAADAIAVGYHFETNMNDGAWVICDDNLAPQGYAYLLIMNGKGTVKSCMFTNFKEEKLYVKRTVEAFKKLVDLQMINPQAHGGTGNFHIPKSAYSGMHPLVGEQAGFQDTLWGFGMRLAISSGVLAAQSLLNNQNYDILWKQKLKPQMETSVVNRALFSLLGNRGYGWFLRRHIANPSLREQLRTQYHPSLYKKLLLPWAKWRYQSLRKDESCNHIDCHCVWCREGKCAHD